MTDFYSLHTHTHTHTGDLSSVTYSKSRTTVRMDVAGHDVFENHQTSWSLDGLGGGLLALLIGLFRKDKHNIDGQLETGVLNDKLTRESLQETTLDELFDPQSHYARLGLASLAKDMFAGAGEHGPGYYKKFTGYLNEKVKIVQENRVTAKWSKQIDDMLHINNKYVAQLKVQLASINHKIEIYQAHIDYLSRQPKRSNVIFEALRGDLNKLIADKASFEGTLRSFESAGSALTKAKESVAKGKQRLFDIKGSISRLWNNFVNAGKRVVAAASKLAESGINAAKIVSDTDLSTRARFSKFKNAASKLYQGVKTGAKRLSKLASHAKNFGRAADTAKFIKAANAVKSAADVAPDNADSVCAGAFALYCKSIFKAHLDLADDEEVNFVDHQLHSVVQHGNEVTFEWSVTTSATHDMPASLDARTGSDTDLFVFPMIFVQYTQYLQIQKTFNENGVCEIKGDFNFGMFPLCVLRLQASGVL